MSTYTIKTGDTLSSLAKQYNTDVKTLADANKIGDVNRIFTGQSLNIPDQPVVPQGNAQTKVPSVIDASNIKDVTNFRTADLPTGTNPNAFMDGFRDSSPPEAPPAPKPESSTDLIKNSYESLNPLVEERTGLRDRAQTLREFLFGKSNALSSKEAELAEPAQAEVSKLKKLIAEKTAAYDTSIASLSGQGRGLDPNFVQGESLRQAKIGAAEVAKLTSLKTAFEEDVLTAQAQAKRAIDLEYEDEELELTTVLSQLEDNKSDMTEANQRRAEELAQTLKDREAKIKDEKDAKLEIARIAQEAYKNGATSEQATKILNSGSVEQALSIGGEVLGAGFRATESQQKFTNDLALKNYELNKQQTQAQIANMYSQIADRKNDQIVTDTSGKVVLKQEDAQKINKELTNTNQYKALEKGKDALNKLVALEAEFKKYGLQTIPGDKKASLESKYGVTTLALKNFFDLGVLNGPDLPLIQSILPNPAEGMFKSVRGRKSGVEQGIETMKQDINTALDDNYKTILSVYGDYSPESVGALDDLAQKYVEQKSVIDPRVNQMMTENPRLSYQDVASILVSN